MGITRTASCVCGTLKIRCEGDPIRVSVCHCHACKRRTGSAFSWNARWPEGATTAEGEALVYTRFGDEGSEVTYRFCPNCGDTVFYQLSTQPGMVAVRAGTFADDAFPPPAFSVYDKRRPDWLVLNTEPLTCIG